MATASRVARVAALALVVSLLPETQAGLPSAAAEARPSQGKASAVADGAVVVLNRELVPDGKLPPIADIVQSPGQVISKARAAGLYVVTDPMHSCMVFMRARSAPTEGADLMDLPDGVLGSWVANAMPQDFLARQPPVVNTSGRRRAEIPTLYTRGVVLPSLGGPAADELIRRHRLATEGTFHRSPPAAEARVTVSDAAYVIFTAGDRVVASPVTLCLRPPTRVMVDTPPARGSVLWWMWPYREASWGQRRVTIAPRDYQLKDLAARLSRSSGVDIRLDPRVHYLKVAAAAGNAPLTKVLWALSVAAGLAGTLAPAPESNLVFLSQESRADRESFRDAGRIIRGDESICDLRQLLALGYASPLQAPAWCETLRQADDYGPVDGERSMGWRVADLPLLYRDEVLRAAEGATRRSEAKAAGIGSPVDPQRTMVFWVRGLSFSVGEGAGRGGVQIRTFLPAL